MAEKMKLGRVLIVDDDPRIARSMSRSLRPRGALVSTACTLEAALRELSEGVDVVVTDYDLGPEGTGLDVIREARNRRPRPGIVAFSGVAKCARRVRAVPRRCGAVPVEAGAY